METNPNRYFLQLSFRGKNYHGWQLQKNASSVQSVLESALSVMLGDTVRLTGCGRTDAGVHARKFVAHFDCRPLSAEQRIRMAYQLNGYLPEDIAVQRIIPVLSNANARFDAVSRTYLYQISRSKNPFLLDFAYYLFGHLDVGRMQQGSDILREYNDFTSFSKLHTQVRTNYCNIMEARWDEDHDLLFFTITADRFLRNMVRAIVGTLLELGKGKITLDELRHIIESRNRSAAGMSVPPQGLYLTDVQYPAGIFQLS
ncbi:MAG TPA: tRNA pseudouridine(38-40) synthase TruA [Bacteroidales bacterium]|nr:tRNA pseudouridine(38-40) synthase TruA [Bacteroidales bacterium]HRZ22183.1 tRNA pseudouridine(38-40) synthase TruA [Bacteroidales bacterium]